MLKPFKSGLPLSAAEQNVDAPTLQDALARFEAKIVRRRYKRGLHQGYLSRTTPETRRITNRMLGERDDD